MSEHYTVLARRFRPQTFEDVVGQEHVGQALRNAIKSGRVSHAYLFTGARGVGKTSTARIFAKALNCPHAVDGVPCNTCEMCTGISAGQDVDVLEIDGASNRGIDDIRQLRANVNIKSMRSKYKVYIIDEVHMLTREAFNALLKTLEEPPPNVKFVFCTTEPNKVPDTILSRCQRFDFGTIATGSIAARLTQIAAAEGIQVDPDAIELVARRAAGSMRDSQSLFDQLLAFGEEQITTADVHQLLGTAPDTRLIELMDALIARDRCAALIGLAGALDEGVQLGPFSDQLLEYLRDLLIVHAGADPVSLLSVGESQRETLRNQAGRWGVQTIAAAMQILVDAKSRMQRANYARAILELALVRIALLDELDEIGRLIQQLGTGAPPSTPAGGPSAVHPTGQPSPAPRSSGKPSDILRQKLQPGSGSPPRSSTTSAEPSVATAATSPLPPSVAQAAPVARPPVPSPTPMAAAASAPFVTSATTLAGSPAAVQATVATDASARSAPSLEPAEESERHDLTPETLEQFWSQVLREIPDTLANHLKNGGNLAISGPNTLEIRFPRSYLFSMNYCQRPEAMAQLQQTCRRILSNDLHFCMRADEAAAGSAAGGASPRSRRNDSDRLRPKAVEDNAFVQSAVSIFGGTVVDVRRVLEEAGSGPDLDRPDSCQDDSDRDD